MQRWQALDYLLGVAGLRTVLVEVGRHYLAEAWGQGRMALSDSIHHHFKELLGALMIAVDVP